MGKIVIKKKAKDGKTLVIKAKSKNKKVGLLDKLFTSKGFKNIEL